MWYKKQRNTHQRKNITSVVTVLIRYEVGVTGIAIADYLEVHVQDVTMNFSVTVKGTMSVLHGSFHQGFYNK